MIVLSGGADPITNGLYQFDQMIVLCFCRLICWLENLFIMEMRGCSHGKICGFGKLCIYHLTMIFCYYFTDHSGVSSENGCPHNLT